MKFLQYIGYLLHFFADKHCEMCGAALEVNSYGLCSNCENSGIFDSIRFQYEGNIMEQHLYGLVKVEAASALMKYTDNDVAHKLIYNLKYNNDRGVAVLFGNQIANHILHDERYSNIDYVVPVPLHINRLKKRGYNQSELVAEQVAKVLSTNMDAKNLYRCRDNVSQTRKSKLERAQNVKMLFDIHDTSLFANKSILLIDDVFTTGSTIIDCCRALSRTDNIKIYVYTVAAAYKEY
ncbi:MAG: hypothetical protein MSH47_02035 [Bacteroidales bacterium]|nr:hypothetical protein [Bacteroidales bacterium]